VGDTAPAQAPERISASIAARWRTTTTGGLRHSQRTPPADLRQVADLTHEGRPGAAALASDETLASAENGPRSGGRFPDCVSRRLTMAARREITKKYAREYREREGLRRGDCLTAWRRRPGGPTQPRLGRPPRVPLPLRNRHRAAAAGRASRLHDVESLLIQDPLALHPV